MSVRDERESELSELDTLNTQRLLALRSFAGFEDLDLADAALLLGAMTERALKPGMKLSKRGAPLCAAWFVVEGELAVTDAAGRRVVHAGETAGMLELLSETHDGPELESAGEAIVLELEKADFTAMLSGNFEMVADAMRSLSRVILQYAPLEGGPVSMIEPQRAGDLDFVDLLLLLHHLSPFGEVGAETMSELAASLTELTLSGTVAVEGQINERIYLVLRGRLRYGALEATSGHGFGALQAIAEAPLAHDLIADEDTRVFAWSLNTIMDALDDDIPFAMRWLREWAQRVQRLVATGVVKLAPP